MIDYEALEKAYEARDIYALQLEVGDVCRQGCIYCYMNALDKSPNQLSDMDILSILDDSAEIGVRAIEWLGGEPLLRDSIFDLMRYSSKLGLINNIWTGGAPLIYGDFRKHASELASEGLISVHISTISPEKYAELHPGYPEGALQEIIEAVEKLIDEGYPPGQMLNSVTFTGLQSSEDMIKTIDFFEALGIKTSLNVYHTYLRQGSPESDLRKFIPEDKEVKKVYARFSEQWEAGELPMNCVNKQYCSATMAVLFDGSVTPCATIRPIGAPNVKNSTLKDIFFENRGEIIFESFREKESLPKACQSCGLNSECFGCRSRAYAAGSGVYGTDPRCFR